MPNSGEPTAYHIMLNTADLVMNQQDTGALQPTAPHMVTQPDDVLTVPRGCKPVAKTCLSSCLVEVVPRRSASYKEVVRVLHRVLEALGGTLVQLVFVDTEGSPSSAKGAIVKYLKT